MKIIILLLSKRRLLELQSIQNITFLVFTRKDFHIFVRNSQIYDKTNSCKYWVKRDFMKLKEFLGYNWQEVMWLSLYQVVICIYMVVM